MGTARIYKKGQLTIPKAVRDAVGLQVGDRVVVEARDDEVVVRPARGVLEFKPPAGAASPKPWPKSRSAARADRAARKRLAPG